MSRAESIGRPQQLGGARHEAANPRRLRRLLVTVDVGVTVAAWLAAALAAGSGAAVERAGVAAVAVAATALALRHGGLYRARTCSILANELRGVARAAAAGGVAALAVDAVAWPPASLVRAAAGAAAALLALTVGRLLFEAWLRHLRASGIAVRPVVLVGDGAHAEALVELVASQPDSGYQLVGYLGPGPGLADRLPWLGPWDDPVGTVLASGAGGVIVAAADVGEHAVGVLARRLVGAGLHVQVSPTLLGLDERRLALTPVAHEVLLYVEPPADGFYRRHGKRVVDVVVATAALVVAAPVLAVAALAIKATDGGPVLYRQERVGRGGRRFAMLKLRTMRVGADAEVATLADRSFRGGPLFKVRDDPRVTRVGSFLRATGLDELPQLLNVLAGTMSLVGPRPALPHEVADFDEQLLARHTVRPGITGLWQVEAEENESFYAYRHLDLFYVENLTLGLDLSIIAATVAVVHARLLRRLLRRRS